MKTNKLIAAALLPLLFSCAKENIAPAETPENADDYITVNLVPGTDTVTKASFDDNEGIIWQSGGFAGIVNADGNNITSNALDKIYDWNGNKQASFKFLKTNLEGKSGPYVLYYPYHTDVKVSDSKYTIPVNASGVQWSDIGKSTEIFSVVSKKAFDLVPLDTDYDNNGADVEFKVVGSYIRILPYGGTKEGEILDYIRIYDIKGENWVSGTYYVSVAVNDDKTTTISKTDDSKDLYNEIILNFGAKPNTNIDKADAKGIYAQVRSGKHQLAYELHTKVGDMDCTYTFKSSKETDFAFGSIKDIPLNITKATETTVSSPEKLYIVGDGSSVGWNLSNAIEMSKNGHIFTTNVYLNTQVKKDGVYQDAEGFKFILQNDSFEPAYVNGGDNTLKEYNGGDGDYKFTVDKAGYYTVTADFSTGKVTCTSAAPEQFYIWGDATEAAWNSDKAIPLDQDQNDKFVFTKKDISLKKGDYKFFSVNSETTAYVNDGNGNLVFFDSPSGTDKDIKFKVAYDGTYDLTVNLKDNSVKCILKTIPQARVKSGEWTPMVQTEPGVFKAEAWWIKRGDNNHDIQIKCGENQYINSGYYKEVTFASRTESLTGMIFDVSAKDIADEKDVNAKYSWWINDNWCKVRYDIIFDSNKNTVTIKYVPAKYFWLVGHINNWTIKDDNYKAEVVDGVATWNIDVAEDSFTDIKICGEEVYNTTDWSPDSEWYYSNGENGNNVNVSKGGEFDVMSYNSDHKWYFPSGKYKVQFNANTFKLIVEKSN